MSGRCACRAPGGPSLSRSSARRHLVLQPADKRPQRRSCAIQAASWGQALGDQGDSPSIKDLEERLNDAIKLEQFAEAAKLRDQIAEAKHDVTAAVEHCNAKFYDAFRAADVDQMGSVWGQGDHVQCIHPGLPCIVGRDAVMEGWKMVFRPQGKQVDIAVAKIVVTAVGNMGYVTCEERVGTENRRGRVAATNIFELQGGTWKMVLHQGSLVSTTMSTNPANTA